jgi:hypothetical protein
VLQRIKWALFIGVPIWFGYGFARDPANLEWVKRVVGSPVPQPVQHMLLCATPHPACVLHPQFPTAASDPQGAHGRQLPTLQDEYQLVKLEQAVDAALNDLARRKADKK